MASEPELPERPADPRPGRQQARAEASAPITRRLTRAWRTLGADQRLAALAACALLLTMLLPWYRTTTAKVVMGRQLKAVTGSESGIQAFTFVEAAVLLIAGSVLFLLFARGERRAFHLPGGDGTIVLLAGAWAAFLIVWRFFDRPDLGRGVSVSLRWGIFVALGAALALAYAGTRVRASTRPEPPLRAAEDEGAGDDAVRLPDERPWRAETQPLEGGEPQSSNNA